MGQVFGGVFYFFIALGILVTIHELGHFLVAKACGVKVLRFSLGFGPIVFKRTAKDGCEYAISAIPLGGYVKMEGENAPLTEEEKQKLPKDSFKAQSVYKRALIIFAGPFFNIILAVILLTIVNMHGVRESNAVVGDVIPNSIAYNSGFLPYDKITNIDGQRVDSWNDVLYQFLEKLGKNENVKVNVISDVGNGQSRDLSLNLGTLTLDRNENPLEKVGIRVCVGKITTKISKVLENSPAQRASIAVGDEIVKVNGVDVDSWYRFQEMVEKSGGSPIELVVKRDGVLYSTSVIPEFKFHKGLNRSVPIIGVAAGFEQIDGLVKVVKYNIVDGTVKAVKDSFAMSKLIVISLGKLINGAISADNISGPIAIAKGAQESASFGIIIFLGFLAAISVNLGILNLLPIPVLDGGQLLFLLYEAITKKEPSAKVQMVLTATGASILLTLMLFAILNDVKGLFT